MSADDKIFKLIDIYLSINGAISQTLNIYFAAVGIALVFSGIMINQRNSAWALRLFISSAAASCFAAFAYFNITEIYSLVDSLNILTNELRSRLKSYDGVALPATIEHLKKFPTPDPLGMLMQSVFSAIISLLVLLSPLLSLLSHRHASSTEQ